MTIARDMDTPTLLASWAGLPVGGAMVADSPAAERDRAEPPMKHLDVSAPQTLSASYLIPLAAPMIGAEVQRRITRAVGTRLTGPLKTLVLQWADQGAVSV